MNKRDSSNFKTAQTLSPNVAHPFNAILGNLNDIKVKTNGRMPGATSRTLMIDAEAAIC